jgi:hypothetical protein
MAGVPILLDLAIRVNQATIDDHGKAKASRCDGQFRKFVRFWGIRIVIAQYLPRYWIDRQRTITGLHPGNLALTPRLYSSRT